MTRAILFLILATGDAGDIPADASLCRDVPAAVARGDAVSVDLDEGRKVAVVAATCFDLPAPIGTCEDDE